MRKVFGGVAQRQGADFLQTNLSSKKKNLKVK